MSTVRYGNDDNANVYYFANYTISDLKSRGKNKAFCDAYDSHEHTMWSDIYKHPETVTIFRHHLKHSSLCTPVQKYDAEV